MSDLLTAAQTQLGYAANEAKSGDTAKALTHIAKAKAFLTRLATDQATDITAAEQDAADWSGTWEQAYARWLDAQDEVLKAAGKPYGRQTGPIDSAERGSLSRDENIAIAKRIGVFDELDGLFGPDNPDASK